MTPIVQFGTSRFLQAHVDLFVSGAAARGEALGSITIIQSSGDRGRARRLAGLAAPFEVRLRGLRNGERVDERHRVTSVARALSLDDDFAEARRVVAEEAKVIISNTADAGFRPRPADGAAGYDGAMSYPAKLAHLLRHRFTTGGASVQVMPTELVKNNGAVLRDLVTGVARPMDAAFQEWLQRDVAFVDSLVDRIVSEPLEPAGAVAEPYALWAIADRPGLILPCTDPAIDVVDDLGPIARRKLFVLNLGHTLMVADWLHRARARPALTREVMADPAARARLETVLVDEVLPGFRAAGEGAGIEEYLATTLERFANPFLDHRLADIYENHDEKIARRIGAFLDWARAAGDTGPKPVLETVLRGAGFASPSVG